MSAFSDELAALAQELIVEFGQVATFTRQDQGVYDPTNLEGFGVADVSFEGSVFLDTYTESEIDGSIIQKTDVKALAHTMTEVPKVGDVLEAGSTEYRIINVDKATTNGATCLYTLQCRE